METDCRYTEIPHDQTGYFSDLVIDYLNGRSTLTDFYSFAPNDEGLKEAIAARQQKPVDRAILVDALERQYEHLVVHESVAANITALSETRTFTVCTAHQPNLMTGYLYFIYKIVHAVKLAQHLSARYPAYKFVPVYYMGSEDNDLDELGVFRYEGEKYRWQTTQTGAVGRMNTEDLQPLLDQLYRKLGPPGPHADQLKDIIYNAYQQHNTISAATRYLVNELLGHFGVVVIDPDDAALKSSFVSILKPELLQPIAHTLVEQTSQSLSEQYKAQAYARPINLFYLMGDKRERIEQVGTEWMVLHTDITWQESDLLQEIEEHPERFSPNVILRGLFQETILPNVAFIGGGSEIAYWLQLKQVFDHYGVFYPALILRQSHLWMDQKSVLLQEQCGLSDQALFVPLQELTQQYVHQHSNHSLSLDSEREQLEKLLQQVQSKVLLIDKTLEKSVEAAFHKIDHQFSVLSQKMVRAEKRNMSDTLERVQRLKEALFPNDSLQERFDTFMPNFLSRGYEYFDILLEATVPYGDRFVIIKDSSKLL